MENKDKLTGGQRDRDRQAYEQKNEETETDIWQNTENQTD